MDSNEILKNFDKDTILNKIINGDYENCGLKGQSFSDRIKNKELAESDRKIYLAIDNGDIEGNYFDLLINNSSEIISGLEILAKAMNVENKVLFIPDYIDNQKIKKLTDIATEYNIHIQRGIINVNEIDNVIVLHILSALKIYNLFNNTDDHIYISLNDEKLKEYSYDTELDNIINYDNVKAVVAGYEIYKMPFEYKTLKELSVKNGKIRTISFNECIVQETYKYIKRYRQQSCRKCVFCREGLFQIEYMLGEIIEGRGKIEYLDLIKEIATSMKNSTSCTVGEMSVDIILSTLNNFHDEFTDHIKRKECSANVCFSSEQIYIDPKLCQGCGECMDVCPEDCIEGRVKYIHMIDEMECSLCGKCMETCPYDAIVRTGGKIPKLPDRLTRVGRFRK